MSRPRTSGSTSTAASKVPNYVKAEGGLAEHWWGGKARAHQDAVVREAKRGPRKRGLVKRAGGEDRVRQIMRLVQDQMKSVTLNVKEGSGLIKINASTRAEIKSAKLLFESYLDDGDGGHYTDRTAADSCWSKIGTERSDRESCVWAPGSSTGQQGADLLSAKKRRQAGSTQPIGTPKLGQTQSGFEEPKMGKTQARFHASIPGYTGFKPKNALARGPIRNGPSSMHSQASLTWVEPPKLQKNGNVHDFGAPKKTKFADYRNECHLMLGVGSPFIKKGAGGKGAEPRVWPMATGFRTGEKGATGEPNEYGF